MLDLIIVAIYLVLLLAIGIYNRSNNTEFHGFATVKDKLTRQNKLILVATIFASSIGGGTTFGLAEKAFSGNLTYSSGLLLSIPIDILIAIYLVPRLVSKFAGTETVGDIMEVNYGTTGRVVGGMAALLASIGFLAAQISVSGRIFEYILQIDYIKGVIISYAIVVIYTTVGGFRSVLFTNLFQFFAILIAIPTISIFGLAEVGIGKFYQTVIVEKEAIWYNQELFAGTISAFLGFSVMNLFPTFIQRALLNKDPDQTKKAIYVKSFIYGVFLIFISINGLLACLIYPEVKPGLALPHLIDHIIPVGIQGIVVTGLLAAVMSTADSDLNITSVTLVKDFLKPIFKLSNQHYMLNIARITNVVVGSLAIYIALQFNSVVDLVVFIAGFWGPIILVPLVASLYNVTIPVYAMLMTSICGGASFLTWEYYFSDEFSLKGVFVGTVASLVVFVGAKIVYSVESKSPIR